MYRASHISDVYFKKSGLYSGSSVTMCGSGEFLVLQNIIKKMAKKQQPTYLWSYTLSGKVVG